MDATFDVAVIGGGVIGLACAWRLGQRGPRVILLERDTCGAGATGASLGALWPASPLVRGPLQEAQRKSLWSYPEFARELAEATGIDIGYQRNGRIELITDDKQLARAHEEAHAAVELWPAAQGGPVMEVITPQQVWALEPAVDVGELGGQLCRASAQVDVQRLVQALRAACEKTSVVIREHAAVLGLEVVGDRVSAVRCGDTTVAAARLLVTAGAWTAQLHPGLAACAPIKPVRGQAIMLETDAPVLGRIIKRGKIYLVPWGRQILVGSTTEPEAGFDAQPTEDGIKLLRHGAQELVPALRAARLVKTWAGLRPDGPKHRPVIGAVPGFANLFVAAGHFKIGVGMAPETAELVKALMA